MPPGIGILHVGVDDSLIEKNLVEHNDFSGIGIVDYCLVTIGTPFDCTVDPEITPGFVADSEATNNHVVGQRRDEQRHRPVRRIPSRSPRATSGC